MPIGVPKVPYRFPGAEKSVWIDIYERLYRERALFLCEVIEDTIANQFIALLLYLSSKDDTNIFMYINSPGGWLLSGLSVYDTMQTVKPDVCTLVMGLAASTASVILVGGTITKRYAYPHARIMIHQPAVSPFRATAKILELEAEEMFHIRNEIAEIYAQKTGKLISVIQKDLERDTYMSVEGAKDYGIIDRIVKLRDHK